MIFQIRVHIDKYEIIFENGKVYFTSNETQEAMEIKPERILKLIEKEFKWM